jgi:hypothetical protein
MVEARRVAKVRVCTCEYVYVRVLFAHMRENGRVDKKRKEKWEKENG